MVFIYNHLTCYQYVIAQDEREARLLFYVRHVRDFYYFKLIGTAASRKLAKQFVATHKELRRQSQLNTDDAEPNLCTAN